MDIHPKLEVLVFWRKPYQEFPINLWITKTYLRFRSSSFFWYELFRTLKAKQSEDIKGVIRHDSAASENPHRSYQNSSQTLMMKHYLHLLGVLLIFWVKKSYVNRQKKGQVIADRMRAGAPKWSTSEARCRLLIVTFRPRQSVSSPIGNRVLKNSPSTVRLLDFLTL